MLMSGILARESWLEAPSWRATDTGQIASDLQCDVLTVTTSLTRFLEKKYQLRLEVFVHEQFSDAPTVVEATLLNIDTSSRCLRRKVSLLFRKESMFDAESVLPLDVLPTTLMAELEAGQRPLANLLSDRGLSLSRTDLSIAHIQGPSIYEHLWARRSVLRSESGATALVTEVFHETFWRKLHYLCQSM